MRNGALKYIPEPSVLQPPPNDVTKNGEDINPTSNLMNITSMTLVSELENVKRKCKEMIGWRSVRNKETRK